MMSCMFLIFNFVLIFTIFCAFKNGVDIRYMKKYHKTKNKYHMSNNGSAPYIDIEDIILDIICYSAKVNKKPKLILQHDYG